MEENKEVLETTEKVEAIINNIGTLNVQALIVGVVRL